MLERLRQIERSVAGMDHQAFLRNDTAIDAVIRNLTVIGEAANRLPQVFKDRHADVPWHRIVGLRHRVVHDYEDRSTSSRPHRAMAGAARLSAGRS
jgi:uncharacterized protein with HEPN domain